ncbi:MAG: Mth938-like domain-containing protein [Minwuia sp.]|uniref:Mth938-like domain-containing protein n=1 Tax=Minwuia sp. TaxID=2493630 RepID=UPI003A8600C3
MDLMPDIPAGRQVLEAYGDGGFRVSGARIEGSLLVLPDETVNWPVASVDDLSDDVFAPIVERAGRIEVLLFGCGESIAFLKPGFRALLKEHDIAVDIMDTGAACRTYNVLMAEDRRVAACLIAV